MLPTFEISPKYPQVSFSVLDNNDGFYFAHLPQF